MSELTVAYRRIKNLQRAMRCGPRPLPKPKSDIARNGLRYERVLTRQLQTQSNDFISVEHNPWFYFEDANGPGYCCPDILATYTNRRAPRLLIIEAKLTYQPNAFDKLANLYVPVVSFALEIGGIKPLVVAKHLSPLAPEPALSLESALCHDKHLIQWLGRVTFPTNSVRQTLGPRSTNSVIGSSGPAAN